MLTLDSHRDYEVTHRLEFASVFDSLAEDEAKDGKLYRVYAHHLARACWHGSRIMLRQTSPEAEGIFDFILELYKACDGQWQEFYNQGIKPKDIDTWLEYCGMFLSSFGNCFDDGNRKAVPNISRYVLHEMASISPKASRKLGKIIDWMMATQPAHLGYPNEICQSSYYPGKERITKKEIEAVTKLMKAKKVMPENTRLRKLSRDNLMAPDIFEILQASAQKDDYPRAIGDIEIEGQRPAKVILRRGDHAEEMAKICADLTEARKVAVTEGQKTALFQLIDSFSTGNYEHFRAAHKTWVRDKAPLVEHCMGFIFGYRDPNGVRAEWQGSTGITHSEETRKISQLVDRFSELVRTLPWAVPGENDGKGPFEPSEPDVPNLAIIHVLASVSSTVWEAMNITIDDENGKRHGVKNMVYGNRMSLNSKPSRPYHYVHPSDAEGYISSAEIRRFIETAIHELIGHGTGKMLAQTAPGKFNFDHNNPPISPVTGKSIRTWYKPGETWNGVFGKLAPTMEECRAFLIASYLACHNDVLSWCGYDQNSGITQDDFHYYTYLEIGVEGLRALRSFKVEDQAWGNDHDQAKFAIFKHLLQDSDETIWVEHEPASKTLFVRLDRSKVFSHGLPSLSRMMTRIHVWHCTADINACRPVYEALSAVDGEYETWRQIVASNPEPKWKFVQPNTFLRDDGTVELREYPASNEGIIQSFFERGL